MLLSQVLAVEAFGLTPLHLPEGCTSRPISRVVTTALLEPGTYLNAGDLVLTELVWWRSPEDSETFVASATEHGPVVIFAGGAVFGRTPDDLVAACRRRDVALVAVPKDVPFADIAEHITAGGPDARTTASLVRQREMLEVLTSGRRLDDVLELICREIGHDCRVLSAGGRRVAAPTGVPALDEAGVDAITRTFLTAPLLPAVAATGSGPVSLFPVGSGLGHRLTAWLLAAEGDLAEWPATTLDAIHELAAIAALERSRLVADIRAARPAAAQALTLIAAGAPAVEVGAQLRQAGLDPDRPLVGLVAELDGTGPPEGVAALVEDVALTTGPAVLVPEADDRVVAMLQAGANVVDLVRAACARLAPGLGRDTSLSVGLSEPNTVDALAGALDEARFAHRAARAGRGKGGSGAGSVSVVSSEDLTSHVLLLSTVPDDVRRAFARRVLGPVIDHDQRSDSQLLATLTTFLDCSGSWARTSEALHVHINTVRYRIDRIQELTGRDLSRLEDRVDFVLALKSR